MKPNTQTRAHDKLSWDEALDLYRGQLSFYLDYLIECDCSDVVLAKVAQDLRGRLVPDNFKFRCMLRVLVQHAIQYMGKMGQVQDTMHASSDESRGSARHLPVLERLVYFLRDVLEYSRRDTSLLIGITDAQVDALLSAARRRIDMYEGPSSIEIQDPNGTYFRWKFADLHLH